MKLFEVPPNKARPTGKLAREWRDYEIGAVIPFAVVHVLAVVGIVMGASWQVWAVCAALYFVRMFAVTGFYHRYFSHRTFKTSRAMQFVMAFVAQTSAQRGAIWWAAHHRDHHKHSDTEHDVHSPKQTGFWYSHFGWLYDYNGDTNWPRAKDLSRYPELVLLDKFWLAPPIMLGVACTVWGGLPGLLVGFMLSTVICWHITFTINSLSHVWGTRPYETSDTSRNNWLLAILTLGEGWHNNHHHFMNSTRQGFRWWEIDVTYMILKAMSWVGLVWDLKEPPAHIVAGTKKANEAAAKATREPVAVRPAA